AHTRLACHSVSPVCLVLVLFSLLLPRPPPVSTLFPYTTLFRSNASLGCSPGASKRRAAARSSSAQVGSSRSFCIAWVVDHQASRSEEHTSELQSREKLVCRLLLEKKKRAPR